MSNPRLAPIPVDAKEFGFDPNHIAEYLDDTIPVEQIPAMERCCLENNALLSEVGSCHRILTKALASPVEVSSDLRDRVLAMPMTPNVKPSRLRILRLGKDGSSVRFDAPTVSKYEVAYASQSDATASLANESPSLPAVRLSSNEPRGSGIELSEGLGHQVPEYLIGYDRSWLRTTLVGSLLVAALVIVGVLAIGPVDQLQSMLSVENRVATPDATSSQSKESVSNKELDGKGVANQETDANNLPPNEAPRGDASNSNGVEGNSTQPQFPHRPPKKNWSMVTSMVTLPTFRTGTTKSGPTQTMVTIQRPRQKSIQICPLRIPKKIRSLMRTSRGTSHYRGSNIERVRHQVVARIETVLRFSRYLQQSSRSRSVLAKSHSWFADIDR